MSDFRLDAGLPAAQALQPQAAALAELRALPLRQARERIGGECFRRSAARTLGWYLFDLSLYLVCLGATLAVHGLWLKLLLGIATGTCVAMMFLWAHDAAHGALFESRRTAEVLGTLFMLPSLNMYRLWSFGHNRIHHGFTSYSPIDWIWRPWTPAEYAAKSRWQRTLYRLERTPYGCALHYLVRVWWTGMVRFNPAQAGRERWLYTTNKLITLVFAVALSALAYRSGGGVAGVVCAVLVPFVVFNYFIAFLVYLHHTQPEIPFFTDRSQWSASIGQIYCSSVIRCSRLMEMLLHNIMIHVPHHVHPHIPFYHLPQAYADLKRHYGQYIHEYRFSWRWVFSTFRQCKLFDYEQQRWYTFQTAVVPGAQR